MKLMDRWFGAGKWVVLCLIAMALAWMACAQSVTTTTVQGTVYLANGTPGQGTLQLSWSAFTTANNQAVAAGRTAVTIDADGFVSVNLAANLGSWPAGLYYTATYYLNDGSTSTEYWVVPAAAQASIAQVRSQVMPAAQAVQAVSKAYVDQAIQSIPQSSLGPSGGTMTGPLYLSGDPLQTMQAADKHYVDSALSQALPLTGGSLTGPINGPSVSASVNKVLLVTAAPYNAKCDGVTDDQAAIQTALNAALSNNYSVQFPAGTCLTSTLTYMGQTIHGAGVSQTTLKGMPGQDVLQTPDSAATLIYGAVIEDMTIAVDASVNAASSAVGGNNTYPNRYTGVGAGVNAGTPVPLATPLNIGPITYNPAVSNNCGVYINDGVHSTSLSVMYASCANNYGAPAALYVGAPVSIAGAGPSGGVLNTTVASIASYWSVNLATPATAAVSNVAATLGYTTAGTGTQPPWYCGNAGIAIPTSNGAAMPINLNGWIFRNLQIEEVNQSAVGNGGNYACGIFIQAASNGLRFENIDVMNMWGGIIEAPPASNNTSYFAWTPDTNSYKDVNLKFNIIPMVWYNGVHRTASGINVYAGLPFHLGIFQFAQSLGSSATAYPTATISQLYQECWTPMSGEFSRFSGITDINGGSASQCGGSLYINWLANQSKVDMQFGSGGMHVAGNQNVFTNTGLTASTVTDTGYENSVQAGYLASDPVQQRRYYANAIRPQEPVGKLDSGFVVNGNSMAPFVSGSDLVTTCRDWRAATAGTGGYSCVDDPTGAEVTNSYIHSNGTAGFGQNSPAYDYLFAFGDRIPLAKTYILVNGECEGATSCSTIMQIFDVTTSTQIGSNCTLTFTATWTTDGGPQSTDHCLIDFSGATPGDEFGFTENTWTGTGLTGTRRAFIAFEPMDTDVVAEPVYTVPGGALSKQGLAGKAVESPSLLDFGGVGDMLSMTGVNLPLSSNTLTCSTCSFTSALIGKTVVVDGTSNSLRGFTATVTAVPSSTTLTLSATNTGTAVTSGTGRVGTNNLSVLNAALVTISGWSNHACLKIPPGKYLVAGRIIMQDQASVCADPLAVIDINNNSDPDYNGIEWRGTQPDYPGSGNWVLSQMILIQPAAAGATTLSCLTTGCWSGSMPVAVGQGLWIFEGSDATQNCANGLPCLLDNIRQYSSVTAVAGDTITLDRPLEFNFNGSTAGLYSTATTTYDGVSRVNFLKDSWWRGGKVIFHHASTTALGTDWTWGGGIDGTTFVPVADPGGIIGGQGWLSQSMNFTMKDTDWKAAMPNGCSLAEYCTYLNNTLENIGSGGAIQEIGQSTNFTLIQNNKYLNSNGTNATFYIDGKSMSYGTRIIGNTFTGNAQSGISDQGGQDDIIEDNTIIGGSIGIGGANTFIPYHYNLGATVANNHIMTNGSGHNCIGVTAYPGAINYNLTGNVCNNPLDNGILNSGNNYQWFYTSTGNVHDNIVPKNISTSFSEPTQIPFGNGNHIWGLNATLPSITTNGDYKAGDIYLVESAFNYSPYQGFTPSIPAAGVQVLLNGTVSTALSGITVTTTNGSSAVTFNSATGLHVGGWLAITGLTPHVFQIATLSGTSGTIWPVASATVTNAAVAWQQPAFAPFLPYDQMNYRSGTGSPNSSPATDFVVCFTGSSLSTPSTSYLLSTFIGKQYVYKNCAASGAVTISAASTTTINGQASVSLPNPGDFLWMVWDGTNMQVIGGSPAALSNANVTIPAAGMADPGGNGLVQRTALNTTTVATAHHLAVPRTCADSSGSGAAQSCTTSPSFTPASGDQLLYSTTTANTGDVTVNVNSSSAVHIRKWSGAAVLASGDLPANVPVPMTYDGTYWELATIGNVPSGAGNVTGSASSTNNNLVCESGTSGKSIQDCGLSSTAPKFSGPVTSPGLYPQTVSAGPYVNFLEDFVTVNTNNVSANLIGSATGSGCAVSSTLSSAGHAGVLVVTSGTAGTGTGEACDVPSNSHSWPFPMTVPFTYEADVAVPVLPGSTVGAYQVGINRGAGTSNPWTGSTIAFYLSSANGVANDWYCEAGNAGGNSFTTDSGIAAVAAAWTRLSITGDGTNLYFWINGTQVCTSTHANSTGPQQDVDLIFTATSLSSTSVALDADYVLMQYNAAR